VEAAIASTSLRRHRGSCPRERIVATRSYDSAIPVKMRSASAATIPAESAPTLKRAAEPLRRVAAGLLTCRYDVFTCDRTGQARLLHHAGRDAACMDDPVPGRPRLGDDLVRRRTRRSSLDQRSARRRGPRGSRGGQGSPTDGAAAERPPPDRDRGHARRWGGIPRLAPPELEERAAYFGRCSSHGQPNARQSWPRRWVRWRGRQGITSPTIA